MRVLLPLPSSGYDPTEVAVPWQALTSAGHEVIFATPRGAPSVVDDRMTTGRGLGIWRSLLVARPADVAVHDAMIASPAFRTPIAHDAIGELGHDALMLPGGHAKGMRDYLESVPVHAAVVAAMDAQRPVAAICHGVVVMARSRRPDGRSVLAGRRTTALLRAQELSAWSLTVAWLGGYYRTYRRTVEAEVRAALGADGEFVRGPLPKSRDAAGDLRAGFTVRDGNYLSARWPGDAHRFAADLLVLLADHT